ncbi:MAG: RHS repeat-associated core domain-containing protein [Myxococcales bacterium]
MTAGSPLATYDAGTGLRLFNYNQNPQKLDEVFSYKTAQGAKYYPHTDMLGSVYAVSDSTGTPQATYSYDVYGAQTVVSGNLSYPFAFTGLDHDTGLYYARDRYYDPAVGSWMSPDRWEGMTRQDLPAQGMSLPPPALVPHDFARSYEYVLDRPTVFNDPTGFYPAVANIDQGTYGWAYGAEAEIIGYCPLGGAVVYDYEYILFGLEPSFPAPVTATAFSLNLHSYADVEPDFLGHDPEGLGFEASAGFAIGLGASVSLWVFDAEDPQRQLWSDASTGLFGLEEGFDASIGAGVFWAVKIGTP